MKKSRVPVLVVGAGAAGTMLTLELARRVVHVRTVDRLPKPADSSRAITVHARTFEILERIDKRLVERFLDGIRNRGYVLHFVVGERALLTSLKPLAHRFAAVLELRAVPPSPALAARYGASDEDRLLLLRPDGYVGFSCHAHELASLEARLHEWFVL